MKKKQAVKKIARYLTETLVPAGVLIFSVILSVVPGGCRTSIDGVEFLSGDFTVPQLEDMKIVDSGHVSMTLSKEVIVNRASVRKDGSDGEKSEISVESEISDDGRSIDFKLEENTEN